MSAQSNGRRIKPSDPIVTRHAITRFLERAPDARGMFDDQADAALCEMVRRGQRWGPSSPGLWHLLTEYRGTQLVLAMKTDDGTGRPRIVTVLTFEYALNNQKRAFNGLGGPIQ